MPLPEYGKWRLLHPLIGTNPPFPMLEMHLKEKSGAALEGLHTYPLTQVLVRPGDSVFLAKYTVGKHHGTLEATYQQDQSLKVDFIAGTVVSKFDGQVVAVRGQMEGIANEPLNISEVASNHPIRCPGDIARWFDGLVMENEHELKRICDKFARENPDSVAAVTFVNTMRDIYSVVAGVAKGQVDALRIGEGCEEGGWGIGKDALRALSFIPLFKPLRSMAGRISTWRGTRQAGIVAESAAAEAGVARGLPGTGPGPVRQVAPLPSPKLPAPLAKDPGEGICWAVSTVNAVRMFKGHFWMTVGGFMRACGMTSADIYAVGATGEAASLGRGFWYFKDTLARTFGILLRPLPGLTPYLESKNILELVKNTRAGSVVLFNVGWLKNGVKPAGHMLVAWKDPVTKLVYIIDRTTESTGRVFRSMSELEGFYPGIAESLVGEAYILENCVGGYIQQAGKVMFALGFTTTLAVQQLEPEKPKEPR